MPEIYRMTTFTDDVYFIDKIIAQETALKGEKIKIHSGQLTIKNCYYDGECLPQAPAHLIHVPISHFSEYFLSHPTRVPKHICSIKKGVFTEESKILEIENTFKGLLNQLHDYIPDTETPTTAHQDTYFFDRDHAYAMALEKNRVKLNHPTIDGLQICYHSGKPFDNAPTNLIYVPSENIYDFFVNTRLRIPYQLEFFSKATEEEISEIYKTYEELLITITKKRQAIREHIIREINCQQPSFDNIKRYRIFILANRQTYVMQYAAKYLAEAFRKLGHQVVFSIEQNDMEDLTDGIWHKKLYCDLNPHITININHQNNKNLPDHVFNVIWWQDPMPPLLKKQPLHWRKRDLIYSFSSQLDPFLKSCESPHINRQYFCVDENIFSINKNIKRETKIVFVGSSYNGMFSFAIYKKIIFEFEEILERGEIVTPEIINQMIATYNLPIEIVLWKLYQYVVRNKSVQWLCKNTTLPVEIYGFGWENDEIVSPFYKGEIKHGQELSKLYNSAQWVLVNHAFDVNSQRLNEASACGAILIVFDCRCFSEKPHWEQEVLYYHSEQTLRKALQQSPEKPSTTIANHFTYDKFAKKIIQTINNHLNEPIVNKEHLQTLNKKTGDCP